MGKKTKVGKQRRDKFYHLAKETGYRSRAAFKLLQLNRKYEFLQRSRVLVDLCAAPGGWLQIAAQNMPVSSLIIGIDLVSIKPIPNVITLQEDITTPKCRQELKKALQTWKVDCFLNDGAPNVGQNWLLDAFSQAQLTLSAFKLASEFLIKGGWFITKIFRSKDYNSLLWVFQQFFKKVYATKPQASRNESAEIFVVCKGYLAPDKIDQKFMDAKNVFAEIDLDPEVTKLNIGHPEKQKHKAEGYKSGDHTLYHRVKASEFVKENNHIELLNDCSEIVLDDEVIANHRLTTSEIKECCKDIKVLGRKELKMILTWRKNLIKELYPKPENENKIAESTDEEAEEEKIDREIEELKMEEAKEIKLKKKKVLKERRKLRDKMNLNMILPKDEPVVSEDFSLFQLVTIKNRKQLEEEAEKDVGFLDEHLEDSDEESAKTNLPKYLKYDRGGDIPDDYEENDNDDDEEEDEYEKQNGIEEESDKEMDDAESLKNEEVDDEDEGDEENNPLITDLDDATTDERNRRKVALWFGKESFSGLDDIEDGTKSQTISKLNKAEDSSSSSSDDSDYDIENEQNPQNPLINKKLKRDAKRDGFEIVQKSELVPKIGIKRKSLDVEGLALGSILIRSKKAKRDVMDAAWNRFTNFDEILPSWFANDEAKHYKKHIPVTKDMVDEYKEKLREIDARPIKKVAEAKARKKRKMLRKMKKARKKAEMVSDNVDVSNKEKMEQIKTIYKKAGLVGAKPKKDVSYVVSKKGLAGKRVKRPAGIKGRFRVVDPRMKKDERKRKDLEKQSKKKRLPKDKVNKLKNMGKQKQQKSSKHKKR